MMGTIHECTGILLMKGLVPGIEVNPKLAVSWWRRCCNKYRHIQAMYELGNAYYLGEGVVEDTKLAVRMFRDAAELGHAGAAYMLGECLLDGVGIERDRGQALDWLTTAAQFGHLRARKRVQIILNEDFESLDTGELRNSKTIDRKSSFRRYETIRAPTRDSNDSTERNKQGMKNDKESLHEKIIDNQNHHVTFEKEVGSKWANSSVQKLANIERRFTIGGGARNPLILARRKTIVAESRDTIETPNMPISTRSTTATTKSNTPAATTAASSFPSSVKSK